MLRVHVIPGPLHVRGGCSIFANLQTSLSALTSSSLLALHLPVFCPVVLVSGSRTFLVLVDVVNGRPIYLNHRRSNVSRIMTRFTGPAQHLIAPTVERRVENRMAGSIHDQALAAAVRGEFNPRAGRNARPIGVGDNTACFLGVPHSTTVLRVLSVSYQGDLTKCIHLRELLPTALAR